MITQYEDDPGQVPTSEDGGHSNYSAIVLGETLGYHRKRRDHPNRQRDGTDFPINSLTPLVICNSGDLACFHQRCNNWLSAVITLSSPW